MTTIRRNAPSLKIRPEVCPYPLPKERTITLDEKERIRRNWIEVCILQPYAILQKTGVLKMEHGHSAIFDFFKQLGLIKHTDTQRDKLMDKARAQVRAEAKELRHAGMNETRRLLAALDAGEAMDAVEYRYRRDAVFDTLKTMASREFNLEKFINNKLSEHVSDKLPQHKQ
jgi:hypothetical protein